MNSVRIVMDILSVSVEEALDFLQDFWLDRRTLNFVRQPADPRKEQHFGEESPKSGDSTNKLWI